MSEYITGQEVTAKDFGEEKLTISKSEMAEVFTEWAKSVGDDENSAIEYGRGAADHLFQLVNKLNMGVIDE